MRLRQIYSLSESDRRLFESVGLFISGRLKDQDILEWALRLNSRQVVERLAVQLEVDHRGDDLSGAWLEVWRLLIEAWDSGELPDHNSVDEVHAQRRLTAGDRSGDMVRRIVDLVRPVLVAKSAATKKTTPKSFSDLLSIEITSPHPIDPNTLGITQINEVSFLTEIAEELDSLISKTMSIARRIGHDSSDWRIGLPRRVYCAHRLPPEEHDPDDFTRGIAAATKLLCAVVGRIAEINESSAGPFISRWRVAEDTLRKRLWCVMAREHQRATPTQVYDMLARSTQKQFWSLDTTPEFAEVRAIRFLDMSGQQQLGLIARLRKGPPVSFWGKGSDNEKVQRARLSRTVRELRRIEICGGTIPKNYSKWYQESLTKFPELVEMNSLEEHFWSFKRTTWSQSNSDPKFDDFSGAERLALLETALLQERGGWDDDPADRATNWIQDANNSQALIADFELSENAGAMFPNVWERFGRSHRPRASEEDGKLQEQTDAERVLRLLSLLPADTNAAAIEGITAWLDAWDKVVGASLSFGSVWMNLWPIAAAATNADGLDDLDPLNTNIRSGDELDPSDLDTLNTAAGRLVGSFVQICPTFTTGENPFTQHPQLKEMRDACLSIAGRSGLIARYRFIHDMLEYLLAADSEWAQKILLDPLLDDSRESLILWRALARRRRFSRVVKRIGPAMISRVADERLGSDARRTLAVSVVLEILHAFNERRIPEVALHDVTQMLRSASNDVRVDVAKVLEQFVTNMGAPSEDGGVRKSVEALFQDSIRPFLEDVWPQESGLSTPAVARGLADLPAACGNEFAGAVQAIYRFLVPFESWSLFDYGLRDRNNHDSLNIINSPEKASALLNLLDATIIGADGVAVPRELSTALEKVSGISPSLSQRPAFRRLATLARR